MAKKKQVVRDRAIELEPPLAGISENLAFEQKPPFTAPVMMNMRPYDPDEERARMGQRPGTSLAYITRIGGGSFAVEKMLAIRSTYIPPEG
jgi:hypothetical protein